MIKLIFMPYLTLYLYTANYAGNGIDNLHPTYNNPHG